MADGESDCEVKRENMAEDGKKSKRRRQPLCLVLFEAVYLNASSLIAGKVKVIESHSPLSMFQEVCPVA